MTAPGPRGDGAPPVALVLAYDGTDFAGWQQQPGRPTVQGALRAALAKLHGVGEDAIVADGAGRTDAGVHALGQVASYAPPSPREPAVVARALAGLLPPSLRVLRARVMPPGFHALRSARGKLYRYRIVAGRTALPFEARWSWALSRPLDVGAMRDAAARLEGRHDFAPFAASGSPSATTVRTLRRLRVAERPGGVVEIDAEADGFLYKMARNLTGLLVEIGAGRRPPSEAARVLAGEAPRSPVRTAPAQGLCLVRVEYDESVGEP